MGVRDKDEDEEDDEKRSQRLGMVRTDARTFADELRVLERRRRSYCGQLELGQVRARTGANPRALPGPVPSPHSHLPLGLPRSLVPAQRDL